MSRRKINIDWDAVDKLAALFCTRDEIAEFLNISHDTLERRCKTEKKMLIASYLELKRAKGRISLRRKQYDVAISGNVSMLIWLGKQWLDQTDKLKTDENKNYDAKSLRSALHGVIDEKN